MNGQTITITDAKQDDYTITVNGDTKIVQTSTATSDALKTGAEILLTGTPDKKGPVQAQSITILLPGTLKASTTGGQ